MKFKEVGVRQKKSSPVFFMYDNILGYDNIFIIILSPAVLMHFYYSIFFNPIFCY